jgi:hypothetical protein
MPKYGYLGHDPAQLLQTFKLNRLIDTY